MTETEKMASEHANWFVKTITPVIRLTYYEAFIHGYKHGFEDAEGIFRENKPD